MVTFNLTPLTQLNSRKPSTASSAASPSHLQNIEARERESERDREKESEREGKERKKSKRIREDVIDADVLARLAAHEKKKRRLGVSRMRKRNTTSSSLSKPRPYKVWREHFIDVRGCKRQSMITEIVMAAAPHVLLNLLLFAYLVFGAFVFEAIDPGMHQDSFFNRVFLCFTTIATIGFGAEVPTTDAGKIACLMYCFVGIPMIYLVLTNDGQFIVDAYWIFRNSYMRGTEEWDGEMPLRVTFYLLFSHNILGTLLYSCWIDDMSLLDAFYFSFVSISTIGFGDIVAKPRNNFEAMVCVFYMCIGMIYLSTLTGSLSKWLQKLHYMGRKFAHVSEIEVWFGGEAMSVRQLITAVAHEFETSPELLHHVLNDLDGILELATNNDTIEAAEALQRQGDVVHAQSYVSLEQGMHLMKFTVTRVNSAEVNGDVRRSSVRSHEASNSSLSSPSTASPLALSFSSPFSSAPSSSISPPPRHALTLPAMRGKVDADAARHSYRRQASAPFTAMATNIGIVDPVRRDSNKSLHALGVVYHTIQKRTGVRRSLAFRRRASTSMLIYEPRLMKSPSSLSLTNPFAVSPSKLGPMHSLPPPPLASPLVFSLT